LRCSDAFKIAAILEAQTACPLRASATATTLATTTVSTTGTLAAGVLAAANAKLLEKLLEGHLR
jgi:hypothetical protein